MGASTGHVSRKYCDKWTIVTEIQISLIAFFFPAGNLAQIWHIAFLFVSANLIICQLKS